MSSRTIPHAGPMSKAKLAVPAVEGLAPHVSGTLCLNLSCSSVAGCAAMHGLVTLPEEPEQHNATWDASLGRAP